MWHIEITAGGDWLSDRLLLDQNTGAPDSERWSWSASVIDLILGLAVTESKLQLQASSHKTQNHKIQQVFQGESKQKEKAWSSFELLIIFSC